MWMILLYGLATFMETGIGIWMFGKMFPERKTENRIYIRILYGSVSEYHLCNAVFVNFSVFKNFSNLIFNPYGFVTDNATAVILFY